MPSRCVVASRCARGSSDIRCTAHTYVPSISRSLVALDVVGGRCQLADRERRSMQTDIFRSLGPIRATRPRLRVRLYVRSARIPRRPPKHRRPGRSDVLRSSRREAFVLGQRADVPLGSGTGQRMAADGAVGSAAFLARLSSEVQGASLPILNGTMPIGTGSPRGVDAKARASRC